MTGHRDDKEAKQMAPQQNEQVSLGASGKQHDDAHNGKRLQQQHRSMGQQRAGLNTNTQVRRYTESGSTQSNGAAATSVEMCAVTAIRRPDGTAARTTSARATPSLWLG